MLIFFHHSIFLSKTEYKSTHREILTAVMIMIKLGNTLILNADTTYDPRTLDCTGLYPLTCGLSLRSTVTASSIGDEGFTYCLQRSIYTLDGTELPPQEFNVFWSEKPAELYPYLALVTLLLLCGVSTRVFEDLRF